MTAIPPASVVDAADALLAESAATTAARANGRAANGERDA